MGTTTLDFVLDANGIDEASEAVGAFLEQSDLDRRNALSARITFESALIRLSEHSGTDTSAQLVISTTLGFPRLSVRVRGERFDPRESGDETDWERSLMESAGMRPSFAYRGGYNVISISLPRQPMGSMFQTTCCLALGAVISFCGRYLPDQLRVTLLEAVVNPLFDLFVGMLAGVAGPMVFLSVAWGICGIGDMASLGRSGKAFFSRYLGVDLLASIFGLLFCMPFFKLGAGGVAGGGSGIDSIVSLLIGLVPTNMFEPFVEGNTPQIIALSVAVGTAALALGDHSDYVRSLLHEFNTLIQFLMEQLCRLLPFFIIIMMVSQSWSGTMGALMEAWVPVVVVCVSLAIFVVILFVGTSIWCKIPFTKLVVTCLSPMVTAFTTASCSAAFGSVLSTCEDGLGIDGEQTSFGVPLGMVLCKPMTSIVIAAFMLYAAHIYGVSADILWYVRLGLFCLLYAVAVPPVPGGMLACYGLLLASLGIPRQALGVITALDLLLDNPTTCGNVGALILSTLSAAKSLGKISTEQGSGD